MYTSKPTISVIIPSHNRSDVLRRTLNALREQTYPLQQLEVLVVVDGCTDGTGEMLGYYKAPFALRVIEQPNYGPAAARNEGAVQAEGEILLFLDDDIVSAPSLIEAHVRAHQCRSGHAVIGYLPPVFQGQMDFFRVGLRTWWENKFHALRQIGHRYTYQDMLSGNFSVEAGLFARVGGFDTTFWCHEDYELGVRLIEAGIPFTFAEDALGYHHENSDLDRSFLRARQEGCADVLIGRRHPELRLTLPLAHFEAPCSPLSCILRNLAFEWPTAGDRLANGVCSVLDFLEQVRLRWPWRHLYGILRGYWYLRGVADELGNRRALGSFLQGGLARTGGDKLEIDVDLSEGLVEAERRLDIVRPTGVHIRYGQHLIGRIPTQPGAERLRGVHLRPILASELSVPLLIALALESAAGAADDACCLPATCSAQSLGVIYARESA
jgi:GT2 family glycosyltransferase